MCKTHIYTEISASGRRKEREEQEFCKRSRHGVLCDRDTIFRHEPTYSARLSPNIIYNAPPTPPRSSHSRGGSDSGSSTKRRSSTYYDHGDQYLEIRKASPARRSRRSSFAVEFEEPVVTDSPPRRFASVRRTAPPSPQLNDDLFQVSDPKELQNMVEGRPRGILKGTRRASRSSHASDEEEYLRSRRINDLLINTKEDQARKARVEQEIKRQNRDINNRPVHVPDAPVVSNSRSYRRPSVVVDPIEVTTSRMRTLDIQEKRDRVAEEEQQQRLRDRIAPRRPVSYYGEPARSGRYADDRYY